MTLADYKLSKIKARVESIFESLAKGMTISAAAKYRDFLPDRDARKAHTWVQEIYDVCYRSACEHRRATRNKVQDRDAKIEEANRIHHEIVKLRTKEENLRREADDLQDDIKSYRLTEDALFAAAEEEAAGYKHRMADQISEGMHGFVADVLEKAIAYDRAKRYGHI